MLRLSLRRGKVQAVSNQLQLLAARGIVSSRRDGASVLYRLDDSCIATLLDRSWCLAEDSTLRRNEHNPLHHEKVTQLEDAAAARKCWHGGLFASSQRAIEEAYPKSVRLEYLASIVEIARSRLSDVNMMVSVERPEDRRKPDCVSTLAFTCDQLTVLQSQGTGLANGFSATTVREHSQIRFKRRSMFHCHNFPYRHMSERGLCAIYLTDFLMVDLRCKSDQNKKPSPLSVLTQHGIKE